MAAMGTTQEPTKSEKDKLTWRTRLQGDKNRNCLDCGRMISFRPSCDTPRTLGDIADTTVPDVHDVVIAAAREQFSVQSPFESAHLASVPKELHHFVPRDAHVVMPDAPIAARRAQNVSVPAERGDLRLMAGHRAQSLSRLDVPQLDVARADADAEERAVVGKVDRGDVRALWRLTDLRHRARLGPPDVRVLGERDGDDVLRRPREQVEVKIVHHPRRVQHPLRLRRDLPRPVRHRARRRRQRAGAAVERSRDLALFGQRRIRRGRRCLVVRQHALVQGHACRRHEAGRVSWRGRGWVQRHEVKSCCDLRVLSIGDKPITRISLWTTGSVQNAFFP